VRMVGAALALLTLAASQAAATTYHAYVIPNPDGFVTTVGTGTSSGTFVGYAVTATSEYDAFRWDGAPTAVTPTNLNTTGSNSIAYGISGGQIIGFNTDTGPQNATIWEGGTRTNLHPSGAGMSIAYSTNGTTQIGIIDGALNAWAGTDASSTAITQPAGYDFVSAIDPQKAPPAIAANGALVATGTDTSYLVMHAFLWANAASITPLDLNPGGTSTSESIVRGVDGNHQVGDAFYDPNDLNGGASEHWHPVVWSSTNSAAVLPFSDLVYGSANASGISGNSIVGLGVTLGGADHALLWDNLNADAPTDLHDLLPAGYISSEAVSIDANGVIFGNAHPTSNFNLSQPVIWVPDAIPEPATLGMLGLGVLGLLVRKRR
ncbi:MAG: PEP-CTERM sorting domain-containing protein, partial [Phycisphaerae bacterium]